MLLKNYGISWKEKNRQWRTEETYIDEKWWTIHCDKPCEKTAQQISYLKILVYMWEQLTSCYCVVNLLGCPVICIQSLFLHSLLLIVLTHATKKWPYNRCSLMPKQKKAMVVMYVRTNLTACKLSICWWCHYKKQWMCLSWGKVITFS